MGADRLYLSHGAWRPANAIGQPDRYGYTRHTCGTCTSWRPEDDWSGWCARWGELEDDSPDGPACEEWAGRLDW